MESGDETGGNFNQSKLVNEREHKERAARHGGGQTQGYCKNVAKHVRFERFSPARYTPFCNSYLLTRHQARKTILL